MGAAYGLNISESCLVIDCFKTASVDLFNFVDLKGIEMTF